MSLTSSRRKAFLSQGTLCFYCRCPMWLGNRPPGTPRGLQCTAEHLLPRSEGGSDDPDNIVAACRTCNPRRHRRPKPMAFEPYAVHVTRAMAKSK
jgi:5-methylcytosine-specific restriction endonuclease McrA